MGWTSFPSCKQNTAVNPFPAIFTVLNVFLAMQMLLAGNYFILE
jgi:hypothetical protein